MSWKTEYRSLYYMGAPEPDDPVLDPKETALLVIDVQNTYLERPDRASLSPEEQRRYDLWTPFHDRMRTVGHSEHGKNVGLRPADGHRMRLCPHRLPYQGWARPLAVAEMPGWNNLLLPKDEQPSQLVPELQPVADEIVVTKTTDSALTGTNLRLILHNLGIKTVICCGIFTDQCVSSTVRSLADESYAVIVLEDCCAAATDELHVKELEIINMIYCHVMSSRTCAISWTEARIPEQNRSLLG